MQAQRQEQEKNKLDACLAGWRERIPNFIKALLIFVLFVFVAAGLVTVWHKKSPELARFIGYLIGGGLLIFQVYISNRRVAAAEETAKSMQKTVELTEKGNIAERFKNAIEHLGNESASIRLGGIYALHHLAQEVEEYRKRVLEILCAHIRETTTQDGYKPRIILSTVLELPSIEIQSILRLLFVEDRYGKVYGKFVADLTSANLQGARLSNANLESARLPVANLQGAALDNANLESARLPRANLQEAVLAGANLQGAALSFTNLQEADLHSANLQGADLSFANFELTLLEDANLQGADLSMAKNLSVDQLLEAETLYKAQLPDKMQEEIKQQKPELLEKPEDKK